MSASQQMLNDVRQSFDQIVEKYPQIKGNLNKCYQEIKKGKMRPNATLGAMRIEKNEKMKRMNRLANIAPEIVETTFECSFCKQQDFTCRVNVIRMPCCFLPQDSVPRNLHPNLEEMQTLQSSVFKR